MHGPVKYDAEYMTLAEAEKEYNLYATVADAETYGFSKDGIARENAQTKRVEDQAKLLYNDEDRRFKLDTAAQERAWERERWEHDQQVRREEADIAREKADSIFREKLEDDRRQSEKRAREERERQRDEAYAERKRQHDLDLTKAKATKDFIAVTVSLATTILTLTVALIKATKGK